MALNKDPLLYGEGSFENSTNFQDLNEKNMNSEMNRTLKEIRDTLRGNPAGAAAGGAIGKGLYDFNHGFGTSPNTINTPFEGNVKRMYPNAISAIMSETGINNFYNKDKFRQNAAVTKFYNDQLAGDVVAKTGMNIAGIGMAGAAVFGGTAALPFALAGGAALKVASNNIRSVSQTHADLLATSGGFMYGAADTSKLGLGMSRKDRDKVADMVLKEGYSDKWWDHADINKSLGTMTNNGMLRSVRSAEEASKKIKELVEASKKVSTILGESLEGATNELNKQKMIGAYSTSTMVDFSVSMERAKKEMGISRDSAYDIMSSGSQQTFSQGNGKQAGVRGAIDAMSATGIWGSKLITSSSYLNSANKEDKLRKIEEFESSKNENASNMSSMINDTVFNDEAAMFMLMRKKKGTGSGTDKAAEFEVDQDMMKKIKDNPNINMMDIYNEGNKRMSGLNVGDIEDFRSNKVAISNMMSENLSGEGSNYASLRLSLGNKAMKSGISSGETDLNTIRGRLGLSNSEGYSESMLDELAGLIKSMNEGGLVKELKEMNRKDSARVVQSEYMKETSVFSKWHEFTKDLSSGISQVVYEPFRRLGQSRKNAKEEKEYRNSIIKDDYDFGDVSQVEKSVDWMFKGESSGKNSAASKREKEFSATGNHLYNLVRSKMDSNKEDDTFENYRILSDQETFRGYGTDSEEYYDITNNQLKDNKNANPYDNGRLVRSANGNSIAVFSNSDIAKYAKFSGISIKDAKDRSARDSVYSNIVARNKNRVASMIDTGNLVGNIDTEEFLGLEPNKQRMHYKGDYEAFQEQVLSMPMDEKTLGEVSKGIFLNEETAKNASNIKTSKDYSGKKSAFMSGKTSVDSYIDVGSGEDFFKEIREENKDYLGGGLFQVEKTIDTSEGQVSLMEMLKGKEGKTFGQKGNKGSYASGLKEEYIDRNGEILSAINDTYSKGKGSVLETAIKKTLAMTSKKTGMADLQKTLESNLQNSGMSGEDAKSMAGQYISSAQYMSDNKMYNVDSVYEGLNQTQTLSKGLYDAKVNYRGRDTNILELFALKGGANRLNRTIGKEYSEYVMKDGKGNNVFQDFNRNLKSQAGIFSMDRALSDGSIDATDKELLLDKVDVSGENLRKFASDTGSKDTKMIDRLLKSKNIKDEKATFQISKDEQLSILKQIKDSGGGTSDSYKSLVKELDSKDYADKKESMLQLDVMAKSLGMDKVIALLTNIAETGTENSKDKDSKQKLEDLVSKLASSGASTESVSWDVPADVDFKYYRANKS